MKHTLTFNVEADYDPSQAGISLPVILRLGSSETHALANWTRAHLIASFAAR